MRDEWRYILNSRDCYISPDGDVIQNEKLIKPYESDAGHRVVELILDTNEYNHETRRFVRQPQEVTVYSLVLDAWFSKWPIGGRICFLDGNKFNCSVHNIRAEVVDSRGLPQIVHVREEADGYVFDKRLKGVVEIVEMEKTCKGVNEAARLIGGTAFGVSKVLAGKLETHRGFHFRWV